MGTQRAPLSLPSKVRLGNKCFGMSNATAFVEAKSFITLGLELQKRIHHCLRGEQFSLEFVFDCFNSLIVSMNELVRSQAVGQSNS
jgi:hypothetical protein